MKLPLATFAAAFWLGVMPVAASAHDAYTAKSVHLRAGPARDYPVVAILPPGTALDVLGCLSDYSWCDVIGLGERGWMYAGNIDYVYQGAPVPLLDYGPVIGITIFGFVLGDYWDQHYHDRPWYRHRDEWIHRPRPVQPPLPPRPRPPGARLPPPRTLPPPVHPSPPLRPAPPRDVRPAPPRNAPPPGHVTPPRAIAPGGPPSPPRARDPERPPPPRKVEPKEPR
jgi:uncharacterized protein YraI